MAYGKELQVDGEQYIKDIIQVPIYVPAITLSDTSFVIDKLIENLDAKYRHIIQKNTKIIVVAAGTKPKDIIRFINRFIISYETVASSEIDPDELLIALTINTRWNNFYNDFISNPSFRSLVVEFLAKSETDMKEFFNDLENQYFHSESPENIMLKHKSEGELWDFLNEYKQNIFNIDAGKLYKRTLPSLQ